MQNRASTRSTTIMMENNKKLKSNNIDETKINVQLPISDHDDEDEDDADVADIECFPDPIIGDTTAGSIGEFKKHQLCSSTKVHGAIRLSSGLLAMLMIVITMVIKMASALVSSIDKSVEDQYMLALYATSVTWITGSLIFGTYCKKEMLAWSKSNKSSNRWIKGLIALFGMAIILKDGLLFLSTFHIDLETCERSRVKAAMYFFHAAFVLAQVVYLFRYAKVFITHCSGGTRMGLMFLIATNLSNWLAAIVDETLIALDESDPEGSNTTSKYMKASGGDHSSNPCYCNDSFCEATHIAEKFLFPFMIEFSLVASILLFITWNNAGKKPPPAESVVKPSYKFYNSYLGAALGGGALVATVIVIIMLGTPTVKPDDDNPKTDYMLYMKYLFIHHGFSIGLEILMIGACIFGFYYFHVIVRPLEDPLPLDVVLLFICILGPFTLNVFGLLAVFAGEDSYVKGWSITYIHPLIDIAQCMLQLGFILFGLEREPVVTHHHHHHHSKRNKQRNLSWRNKRLSSSGTSRKSVEEEDDDDVDSDYYASTTYENRTFSRSRPQSQCDSNYASSSTASPRVNTTENQDNNDVIESNNVINDKVVTTISTTSPPVGNTPIGRRIFKRIRHVSSSKMFATTARFRKRSASQGDLSSLSEATVARPDLLRLRLRDIIMFLILSNVCLWIFQSLEGTAFTLHTYQSQFFGHSAWTTILMICRPLSIFFRMHSAGCLFEMWSYA